MSMSTSIPPKTRFALPGKKNSTGPSDRLSPIPFTRHGGRPDGTARLPRWKSPFFSPEKRGREKEPPFISGGDPEKGPDVSQLPPERGLSSLRTQPGKPTASPLPSGDPAGKRNT